MSYLQQNAQLGRILGSLLHLSKLLRRTKWLGLITAEQKVEGPSTRLIDSEALVLRFPRNKLLALKEWLASWKDQRSCKKSDLQSLAGSLLSTHARSFVQGGYSLDACLSCFKGCARATITSDPMVGPAQT
jgi:hypothetical protein